CRPAVPPGGPLPPGSGARDRLALPTGTVVDLAGNVAELLVDRWNTTDEPCWSRPGLYRDPVCDKPSKALPTLRSARGGDWLVSSGQLAHRIRVGLEATTASSPELGFRCARPGRPGRPGN